MPLPEALLRYVERLLSPRSISSISTVLEDGIIGGDLPLGFRSRQFRGAGCGARPTRVVLDPARCGCPAVECFWFASVPIAFSAPSSMAFALRPRRAWTRLGAAPTRLSMPGDIGCGMGADPGALQPTFPKLWTRTLARESP